VAREVSAALRPGETLVAAASNAVRDLDLAARPATGPTPLVVANRGLSGIDGTLSTAVGVALATRRPVRALVGDLAFLHDLNALVAAPGEERPQVQVVVLDDDGGGIFSLLEHGQRATTGPGPARAFERVFGTPHGLDLVALAGATGVPARRAETLDDLRAALAVPLPGTSVVVVRAERAGLRELHARVRAAVHAAAEEAVREAAGV
jgi:2-succinyl-5-enolpyruvyl-6-hydroxy-3-cyclohexene-1-carboxylate synthase